MHRILVALVAGTVLSAAPNPLQAQNAADRYDRAERFLSWNVSDLVTGTVEGARWIDRGRLLYRTRTPAGLQWVVVDGETGVRQAGFDPERLARALGAVADTVYDPHQMPVRDLEWIDEGRQIRFTIGRDLFACDLDVYRCVPPDRIPAEEERGVRSPDGRSVAFIRDHNLWVLDRESGEERRLTHDGRPRFGYATDSQGWRRTERPILTWAPDSRSIATYRLDERGVEDMVLWETRAPRPRPHLWPYALPGDSVVPLHERVVVHLDGPRVVRLRAPADHQRTSSCCGLGRGDVWGDTEWSDDAGSLAYVSMSRDYTTATLRIADPRSGAVREILSETDAPFIETTASGRGVPAWRVLHERGEVLWYSWRDGWGHLYRYDLETGRELGRVTRGAWSVEDVVAVDEEAGWVYFTGLGREEGRDPYFRHLYRAGLDGSAVELLTPEDADHDVLVSPDGRFFLDTHSRRDRPQIAVLRRADGDEVAILERADDARLLAEGWRYPVRFDALARDGETALHGLLFLPTDLDESSRYPVVVSIYPGPQAGSVGTRSFTTSARGQAHALAELGFVVVQLDALGTPGRSRDFHAYYAGDMADNGLPDHIAVLRQLADRHPWMDLSRVGIFGHSGGGFATAAALLLHPDFFHVGVASAGNMDNAGYTYYWGEKWQGPLVEENGEHSYQNQALHRFADRLQGNLLISYGTMDTNVPPNMTLLLVDALIEANKDFDLMVFPNRGHGFSNEPYQIRLTWDYFVRHLLGDEPPTDFRIEQ